MAGIFGQHERRRPDEVDLRPGLRRGQAKDDGTWKNSSIRLTWQATPRNKFSVWWDEQVNCQSCVNGGAAGGPSATLTVEVAGARGGRQQPQSDSHGAAGVDLAGDEQAAARRPDWPRSATRSSATRSGEEGYKDMIRGPGERPGIVPGITYRGLQWAAELRRHAHLPRVGVVHHRRAQHSRSAPGSSTSTPRSSATTTTSALRLRLQQRRPGVVHDVREPCRGQPVRDVHDRALRAGPVDHGPADPAGRPALRAHQAAAIPEAPFPLDLFIPAPHCVPGAGCRRRPEGHQPPVRGGVRPVRQRQDITQGSASAATRPPTTSYGTYGLLQQPAIRVATNTTRGWNDLLSGGRSAARELRA